jgi:hypothetical protein
MVTAEEFLSQATRPKAPTSAGRTALEQGLQGATFGFGEELYNPLGAAMATPFVAESLGDIPSTFSSLLDEARTGTKERLTRQQEERPVLSTGSQVLGGLTSAAGLAKTAGGKALGNLAGRFGTPGAIAAGALGGETAQRTYEAGTAPSGEKLEKITRPGVSLGGVLGGAIPGVGAAVGAGKRALTPAISDAQKQVVSLAKKYDIPLGLDDLTDSKFYKYMISEGQNLPFSGAGSKVENQLSKFTKAVARSVGLEDVDNLTPVNMDKAFNTVGAKFDDLTKGKTFTLGDEALDSLSEIEEAVRGGTYGAQGERLLGKHTTDLFTGLDDNRMTGDNLAKLRNKFAKISRSGTDIDAKTLAKDFENVLVEMIGEGAPEALKKAKYQYKNLIAVEPLARKSRVDGYISPAQLSSRVAQVYKRQFTRGKAGELGDLATLGQAIKQSVPQSGTAPRQMAQNLGVMDLAALGTGAVNPILPATYFGGKLGKLGINRALQSRNVNPEVISRAINPVAASAGQPLRTGIGAGSVLGSLQQ